MVDLLIGTYTEVLPHVDGRGAGIHAVSVADGAIGPVSMRVATPNPSYLALASDGCCYAVDEVGATLAAFDRDFAPLGRVPTEGVAPCHVAVSPDERFVLVAHWGSGTVSVHERRSDGSLGAMTANVRHGDGARTHMVAVDPTDDSLLVCDLGLDTVFGYQLGADGSLRETARLALPSGTGPRHVAFAGDGAHLYVVGELASDVTTFERSRAGWRLVGSTSTLPAGISVANTAAAIRVHGERLFVSNRGHDSVAMFSLNPLPSLVAHGSVQGRTPRDFVVLPDGAQLLVADQDSNDLSLFAIESASLTFLGSRSAPSPVSLVVVP